MRRTYLQRLESGLKIDTLLYGLSLYAIPILIGIASLYAVFALESQYPFDRQQPVAFHVLEQSGTALAPEEALRQLERVPTVSQQDTKLSEAPYWLSFSLSPGGRQRRLSWSCLRGTAQRSSAGARHRCLRLAGRTAAPGRDR